MDLEQLACRVYRRLRIRDARKHRAGDADPALDALRAVAKAAVANGDEVEDLSVKLSGEANDLGKEPT
jgi:hypothetical protein